MRDYRDRQTGKWVTRPKRALYFALTDIFRALDFGQHFDRQVKEMLEGPLILNNRARARIAEIAASEAKAAKAGDPQRQKKPIVSG